MLSIEITKAHTVCLLHFSVSHQNHNKRNIHSVHLLYEGVTCPEHFSTEERMKSGTGRENEKMVEDCKRRKIAIGVDNNFQSIA
jgi:hypothetical protein